MTHKLFTNTSFYLKLNPIMLRLAKRLREIPVQSITFLLRRREKEKPWPTRSNKDRRLTNWITLLTMIS